MTGVYPKWLIPLRFRRAIEHNAQVPPPLIEAFRRFAVQVKDQVNEATLGCYWKNFRDLALSLRLKNIEELNGAAGVVTECRLGMGDPKRLVHHKIKAIKNWKNAKPEDLPEIFRQAQENILVKFWTIIKDRPAELWAKNWRDWRRYCPEAESLESQLFDGDGTIFNNFRESTRKKRPDKPSPKWLAKKLEELWRIRRACFAVKGESDRRISAETGLIKVSIPL